MPDDWYYAKNGERRGPVSLAKLRSLAEDGWLAPADPVWRAGMADWVPARDVDELFGNPLVRALHKTIPGLRPSAEPGAAEPDAIPPETRRPDPLRKGAGRTPRRPPPDIAWAEIAPRHVVAACGGFLAALGLAFTVIAQSRIALAFTLSGMFIAAAGLYVEVGRLAGQAVENFGKASRDAAERRLRAKELALEKQRLDIEAARLAEARAARPAPPLPASVLAPPPREVAVSPPDAAGGQIVVINEPPVQQWSPGVAAVLSFFVPGLGQLYKGQAIGAIMWFVLVGLGYLALCVPGLILHLFCVLGALSGNPWTEGRTTVVRH